jgi:META domain
MKAWIVMCAALAVTACGQVWRHKLPDDLDGRWKVQEIAEAQLGQDVQIWIDINAETGAVSGFTGCHDFTATMSGGFGATVAMGAPTRQPGACPSPAAATDEARFLGVLPSIQRYIRHGLSLELLQAAPGSEALLKLRRDDAGRAPR